MGQRLYNVYVTMGLKITVKTAHEAFLYNDQINDQGLRRDFDYTWRFTPAVNTWLGDETITPATVEFNFKDRQWETYFQLRWAK
jgi:hypothetical protein